MGKDFEILAMQPVDLDEVIKIGRSTPELQTSTSAPQFYSKETLERWVKSSNGVTLVAKVKGNLAGFRLASYNPDTRDGYLHVSVVLEEYRRRGIYDALLAETLSRLKTLGCNHVWATVKPGNRAALEALKKHGFEVGELFHYVERTL